MLDKNKKEKQLLRKEKDKNITLLRDNQRLCKILRNLSYILSSEQYLLRAVDDEKYRISSA
jgi:hypothetical protein